MKEMYRIIEDEQHLTVNPDKTRLQTLRQRQEVTGLIVNRKVNVTQRYLKQIRLWLHYWEIFGYNRAQNYFITQYAKYHVNFKNSKAVCIENVLGGKLDFMRMVVGDTNRAYKKLHARYEELLKNIVAKPQKSHLKDNASVTQPMYISTDDVIMPIPKNGPAFVAKEELEVMLDGLLSDLREEEEMKAFLSDLN